MNAPDKDRSLSNEKLLEIQQQSDYPVMALWERIFDAGRYYFLSSSSELTPPDLLGIWTGDCQAGWGGFYHLDANLNLQVSSGNIAAMPEAMEGYFKINEAWRDDFRLNARNLLVEGQQNADQLEQDVSMQKQNTSKMDEAQKNIQKILKEKNLVNEDLKGIEIDLNF